MIGDGFLEPYVAQEINSLINGGEEEVFSADILPHSGRIGQADTGGESNVCDVSMPTALRRFFENQTAGIILIEPYWLAVRRSELGGTTRYLVITTYQVTMTGMSPDPTDPSCNQEELESTAVTQSRSTSR